MAQDLPVPFWSNFFQFSYNSYSEDASPHAWTHYNPDLSWKPVLRWDDRLWDDLVKQIVDAGVNQIIFSLGDGIRYDSHPEIAVQGAWTPAEMKAEKARLAGLGITLVPKLNFSAGHDLWLGPYHRMVSTPTYYQVCSDLIAEVIDIFDNPPLFHLGYDEETYGHQRWYEYIVVRENDLWWRDFLWFVEQVESRGTRPWMWSDKIWTHTSEFMARMPQSVIQSNWYYAATFDEERDRAQAAERGLDLSIPPTERMETTPLHAYRDLQAGGWDQVPAASIDVADNSFPDTVTWVQANLPRRKVLGFMQTTWRAMLEPYRDRFELGIEKMAEGIQRYDPDGWSG
ncbi:MAG: hypothetical protein WBA46_19385 [Thermomicrobiales bacterium]